MVVKVNNNKVSSSAPASPSPAAAADPLRGASTTTGGRIVKDKETEVEFCRLKKLVPTISKKSTVSKLDVILEAIRYIDQLQDQLVEQINDNKISVAATALLVGKENTGAADAAMIKALQKQRHKSSSSE